MGIKIKYTLLYITYIILNTLLFPVALIGVAIRLTLDVYLWIFNPLFYLCYNISLKCNIRNKFIDEYIEEEELRKDA